MHNTITAALAKQHNDELRAAAARPRREKTSQVSWWVRQARDPGPRGLFARVRFGA